MSPDDAMPKTDESTTGSLSEHQQAVAITDSESLLLRRAQRSTGNDRVYTAIVATIIGIVAAVFLPFGGWVGAITNPISIFLLLRANHQGATLARHMVVLRVSTFVVNIILLAILVLRLVVVVG